MSDRRDRGGPCQNKSDEPGRVESHRHRATPWSNASGGTARLIESLRRRRGRRSLAGMADPPRDSRSRITIASRAP